MGLTVVTSGGASTIVTRHPVSGTIVTREPLAALAVVTRQIAAISGVAAPTVQATTITFATVTSTSMIVNFTDGDGTGRLLVGRAGSAVTDLPVDSTTYTPSLTFGSGTDLGNSTYAIALTSGPHTVVGLTAGTTYHFRVFEFNS